MLSSGVDCQERSHPQPLDFSMSAVVQELYTGLPVSISTELTAESNPNIRLDAKPEASTLVLAHNNSLLSECQRIYGVENCSQGNNLGHGENFTSHRLAGCLSEESPGVGNPPENEETNIRILGKQESCARGNQKEERGSVRKAQVAEKELVGCCAVASEEKLWLRQEEDQINQSGGEVSRICCTEKAGLLKSKEENQTNVQVTPEILPKPSEELQGMKADGTRIFSKAGRRNDRVSEVLQPEKKEGPDIDTITASGEVSVKNTLVPIEPLAVVETGSTKEYQQEEKEDKGLTACTFFDSAIGELLLSRSNHVIETSTIPDSYQTFQQDEENSQHNYAAFPVSKSSEADIPLSKESSEALYDPLSNLCSLDPGNMPLEDITPEICETQDEYLTEKRESSTCNSGRQRTDCISRPVMEKQFSPVYNEEMSSGEPDQSETGSCTDHSHSCGYGKVAEIQREIAMKNSCGMDSRHGIQDSVRCESSDVPVPTSVSSSTEELPKGHLKIPSEINLKKDGDQWQTYMSDACCSNVVKQHSKENSNLLVDGKNLVSETGDIHTCCNNSYNKYTNSPATVPDFLDYGAKLNEEVSLEVQALGHDAEKSRPCLRVVSELPPCNADVVSGRNMYLNRQSKKEPITASAKLEAQPVGLLLHKNEELSLVNHESFNTTYIASKDSQERMHSALGDTEKMVIDMENEENNICAQNDQCMKDHCSAVTTCFILSDSTSLDNATLNRDTFEVQAKLKIEEVSDLEIGHSHVHNDKKAVSFPEENIHVACESVPCEGSWNCSSMFQYMANGSSTAEKLLHSACTSDESTTRLSEVGISSTNMEVESLKLYNGHCEITEKRLDSDNRERTFDTNKGQEQINSCALQKDEADRIKTLSSVKAHKGSHQNETSGQSINRDLNKTIVGIHLEFCSETVDMGEGELKMYKKTALPCEHALLEGNTSKSDTDASLPNHEKHLDQSFDLELSYFKHSKQPNDTFSQVENQYLACQIDLNGPVSRKQNETQVADEVLVLQQADLDISEKQIANAGVQIMRSSVEEPKRTICSKRHEPLILKKNKNMKTPEPIELKEKHFQGAFKEIIVDNSSSGKVDRDYSEYTGSISDLSEVENTELKESGNVGSSIREAQGTFKESVVGYRFSNNQVNEIHSEYIGSISSAKEDQKEECTILAENTKLSALAKMGSLDMDPKNKIKTIVESFSVSQSTCKNLSYVPENTIIIPGIRNETCLLLDSAANHRIIEITKACPEPELVTFTVNDGSENRHPVQAEEFCANQELPSVKRAISETPLAENSEVCLAQKGELPATSKNAPVSDQDSSAVNTCCNDCSTTEPLVQRGSFERRANGSDSPSEEREKAISSINDEIIHTSCLTSHAHSKDRPVSSGDSEPFVKEMDVISSDNIDVLQKFKSPSIEDQRENEATAEKIKMPMHSIFAHKNLGVLLEDVKFSGDKVRMPSKIYSNEQIPEWHMSNLSDKGKTYVTDHSASGAVQLLSETVDSYLQTKDLTNNETSDFHFNTTDSINKLSKSDTEASLKCLDRREVCFPYELSSQRKDHSKEVIGDQMKMPSDSISAKNEMPDAERLTFTYFVQTLKRKMCEETEVCPAQNMLLPEGQAHQIQVSKDQEEAKIPLQDRVVFDTEPLESSDEFVESARVMKTEDLREQVFTVMRSKNDCDNKQIYSTLQEIKRPKISKDNDNLEHMKTMNSEVENPSFHLGTQIELSADNTPFIPILLSLLQAKGFSGNDEMHGAFGNTHRSRGLYSVRQQPERKCKKVPTLEDLKIVRKNNKVKSSAFVRSSPEAVPTQEPKLLSSAYFACKPSAMETEIEMRLDLMSKQRANRCSLSNHLKLRKCTKERTLLSRLSTMANKLLAPRKSIHGLKTLHCSSELPAIEKFSQIRAKKLLDVFSCINMKLNSHQADSLCTKMFNLQPLALYPVDSSQIHILDLSSNIPSSVFKTPISPISFHIKLDSDSLINLTGILSQQRVAVRPALGEAPVYPSQLSKWIFSFLLSHSCSGITAFREDANLNNELHSSALTTTEDVTLSHDSRGRPIAKRRTGCSMLGLHTVLALSSPGCYRIWTRRRNVTSRIPTVQRLFISHFTQGLKGLRSPTSVSDDLFSSLPYSLGRVLAKWSQHGPSAYPSEFTPLHSSHCKWQPSLGIKSSSTAVLSSPSPQHIHSISQNTYGRNEIFYMNSVPNDCRAIGCLK
ncbi:protein PRR14L isoform X2 [Carettochelys insculpta]|uniref:protein PRR14L isoform X2 n=1 Tax=Carettochelys insculpta TaxID=44489 RepID=UPI003EBB5C36